MSVTLLERPQLIWLKRNNCGIRMSETHTWHVACADGCFYRRNPSFPYWLLASVLRRIYEGCTPTLVFHQQIPLVALRSRCVCEADLPPCHCQQSLWLWAPSFCTAAPPETITHTVTHTYTQPTRTITVSPTATTSMFVDEPPVVFAFNESLNWVISCYRTDSISKTHILIRVTELWNLCKR